LLWGDDLFQELRFVLVLVDGVQNILVSTSLLLTPEKIIPLYCARFKIEIMFKTFKQIIDGFGCHFWSRFLPVLSRRDPAKAADEKLKELGLSFKDAKKAEKVKESVINTYNSIEGFVMFCCIAAGILQLAALTFTDKNETYYNADIEPERSHLNVHFCRYQFSDGTPVTYEQRFNQILTAGTIVKRGLKDDANVIDELVYDVNTAYFEENGGYEFARKFYEEAYKLAVKEVGSEDYIISAVMHADEKNVGLSEQLGRDVYHYHLHIVYVPVVEKEVLWSKRCKDPALVGTVKEVIPQISHSKKVAEG
jgi:hypothetical protein